MFFSGTVMVKYDGICLQIVEICKIGYNKIFFYKKNKSGENGWISRPKNGPVWPENAILRGFKYLFVFSKEYTVNWG